MPNTHRPRNKYFVQRFSFAHLCRWVCFSCLFCVSVRVCLLCHHVSYKMALFRSFGGAFRPLTHTRSVPAVFYHKNVSIDVILLIFLIVMYSLPVTTAERGVVSAFWAFLSALQSAQWSSALYCFYCIVSVLINIIFIHSCWGSELRGSISGSG